ncbi:hypothetical protein LTR70_003371 [Exophiala xenobiotica]|uniref:Aminoglycoside phosphotransferase domain-containing protein n=1 Tax=Lithohypha guttulata TaxID=1690604 RepID=A0ABR0KGA1_9EURO|nr:hypothetical protein LTR24_002919 [Lithohypha guttulata]KAK5323509.1 hypothetical protein LTR70_003371 [Exophiala xenobiotica]
MVRPRWTHDLLIDDLKAVALQALAGEGLENLKATFLAEGLFNRVYRVHTDQKKQSVLRVSLPTNPHNKTACEVATLEYLKLKTSLPVPDVYKSDSSSSNPLGYEYILEEFVPGTQLSKFWNKLSFPQLSGIIRQLATYQAQLFQHRFAAVGGLRKAANGDFVVGSMADIQFFWYERIKDQVYKGSFDSTHSWLDTLLLLKLNESRRLYEEDKAEPESAAEDQSEPEVDEEDEASDFEPVLHNIEHLSQHLPKVWARAQITGIIDWENVSAVSLWAGCELPALLAPYAKLCHERPDRNDYEDVDLDTYVQKTKQDGFDNEGKEPKFWQRELEWQRTQLRVIFLEEMQKICPSWVEVYHKSEALRDFYNVCMLVDNVWEAERVKGWIDGLEAGEKRSFVKVRFEREAIHISDLVGDVTGHEENVKEGEKEDHDWTPAMLPELKGAVDGGDAIAVKSTEVTTQPSAQQLDLEVGIWRYLARLLRDQKNRLLQLFGSWNLVDVAK